MGVKREKSKIWLHSRSAQGMQQNANFMVGTSYSKDVFLCELYPDSFAAAEFAEMVRSKFPKAFDSKSGW